MARNNKLKFSKITDDFNNISNHPNILDIYKTLTPESAEYMFFSHIQSTVTKIDHTMGYELSVDNSERHEIIFSMISDHKKLKRKSINTYIKKPNSTLMWNE